MDNILSTHGAYSGSVFAEIQVELEVEEKCEEKTINNDNDKGKPKEDKDHVSGQSSTVTVSRKVAGFRFRTF